MTNKYLEKIAVTTSENHDQKSRKFSGVSMAGQAFVAGTAINTAGAIVHKKYVSPALEKMVPHTKGQSSADLGTIRHMIRKNKLEVSMNDRGHALRKAVGPRISSPSSISDYKTNAIKDDIVHAGTFTSAPGMFSRKHLDGSGATKDVLIGGRQKDILGNRTGVATNPDVIMHELGHAKDYKTGHSKLKSLAYTHGTNAAAVGAGAALLNEKTQDYATPIAVLGEVGKLRAEGAANYHAYQGIKSHKGAEAAKKFATKLVPKQMATYALPSATIVGSTYAVQKLVKHYRDHNHKVDAENAAKETPKK